jgi:hypothetical protein
VTAERLPWGKFVWAHWENDEGLACCSMGAQGFWMRLLCTAVKEGGYVLIAGKAPTAAKLAHIVRATAEQVDGWLSELETEGVFSRTGDGVIYSRRLVKEAKEARRNRENGAKGGNPKLRKDNENPTPDNPSSQPHPQPPSPKGVKAEENREEKEEEGTFGPIGSASPSDLVTKAELDALWAVATAAGRRRSGRKDVERAVRAAIRRGATLADIRNGVAAYYASDDATKDGGEWAKGLHRLIENDRWREYDAEPATLFDGPKLSGPPEWQQRAWMRDFIEALFEWREHERGPKPGQPGCRVAPALQREFGVEPAAPQPVGSAA